MSSKWDEYSGQDLAIEVGQTAADAVLSALIEEES